MTILRSVVPSRLWYLLKNFFRRPTAIAPATSATVNQGQQPSSTTSPLTKSTDLKSESIADPETKQSVMVKMVTAAVNAGRRPLIHFLGPRHPQPHFDHSKLPPIHHPPAIHFLGHNRPQPHFFDSLGPVPHNNTTSPSSIRGVKTVPRNSIDEALLPLCFRRRPIDQEEIDAINNGGAYGL